MKHLKAKLMAAVAMLLVATVMLTSASFAWFTISTAPEITDLTTQVVVNENLEIALLKQAAKAPTAIPSAAAVADSYGSTTVNTGSAYTWGNLIDLGTSNSGDEAVTDYGKLEKTVRPATLGKASDTRTVDGQTSGTTLTAGTFYYPAYGTDGRVTELKTLTEGVLSSSKTTDQWGFGNLIVTATDATTDPDEAGKVYGYYVDYWVRSNMSGDLELSAEALRSTGAADADKGAGTYFESNKTEQTDATKKADELAALKTLTDNVRIAFKDITPSSITEGADAPTGTVTPVVATAGTSAATTDGKGYKVTFTCDKIVTLKANQAKLIRVYVYLEGESVTNAAASLDNFANGGKLNIQFCMDNVDKSMDASTVK